MPTKIDFKEELKKIKNPVWEKIQKYLPKKYPEKHYDMIAEYPRRQGKYFRPGLVLFSAKMFGGATQKALLTAASMQMSEEWLLIHDDFEDHSEERRSTKDEYKPTLNKMYGDELSVNAGDTLHAIMWKMLADNTRYLGEKVGWNIYEKMNDVILKTCEGQYLELNWIREKRVDITEEEYYEMIYRKAGYYTVTAPLQLGAIVTGASEKDIKKIEEWGIPFGQAFQIWDDVMNVTIKSEAQGKEMGGDILEGKRTLLLIHLLKNCSGEEKEKIISIYLKNRDKKTTKEKEWVIKLMEKYGSINYAKETAKDLSEKAQKIFDKNTSHLPESQSKKIIREAINFVVNRDR